MPISASNRVSLIPCIIGLIPFSILSPIPFPSKCFHGSLIGKKRSEKPFLRERFLQRERCDDHISNLAYLVNIGPVPFSSPTVFSESAELSEPQESQRTLL